MAKLKFGICNHPAQARHPLTKEPLIDDNGDPVPLFVDEKALTLEGEDGPQIIAYVSKSKNISFIVSGMGEAVIKKATEFVEAELGKHRDPVVIAPAVETDDEPEDEDE